MAPLCVPAKCRPSPPVACSGAYYLQKQPAGAVCSQVVIRPPVALQQCVDWLPPLDPKLPPKLPPKPLRRLRPKMSGVFAMLCASAFAGSRENKW